MKQYIYTVIFKDWRGIMIHNAYRSRRMAYRIADTLEKGSVQRTELIEKKFIRPDALESVPKKNGRSVKRKNRK